MAPKPLPPASTLAVNAVSEKPPAAPAVRAQVELPSTDPAFLYPVSSAYTDISRRMGEHGTVKVRVLVGTDGTALKAEIVQSSGFDRLDQEARKLCLKAPYRPGTRGGIPEAMWVIATFEFTLR